jgi:hypothetical protein
MILHFVTIKVVPKGPGEQNDVVVVQRNSLPKIVAVWSLRVIEERLCSRFAAQTLFRHSISRPRLSDVFARAARTKAPSELGATEPGRHCRRLRNPPPRYKMILHIVIVKIVPKRLCEQNYVVVLLCNGLPKAVTVWSLGKIEERLCGRYAPWQRRRSPGSRRLFRHSISCGGGLLHSFLNQELKIVQLILVLGFV